MNELTARNDYAIRLERVITWLVAHLDDALDLGRLADVACMSPYHFHRIYLNDARTVAPAELRTEIWLPLRWSQGSDRPRALSCRVLHCL